MIIEDVVMECTPPHPDNPFAWETKNSRSKTGEGMATTYLPNISNNEESSIYCADVRNGGEVRRTNAPKTKPKGRSRDRGVYGGIFNCHELWEILG